MEGYCSDYSWSSLFVTSLALYFLINFIVDHWISTKVRKNILVTGCDSGFGLQTALELSASNCHVFASCLTQDGVNRLQNDAKFQGMAFIMDVTKDDSVQKAKEIIKQSGDLDGIVNNAGIALPALFEWQSIEFMKKTFEVNYWGTVRVTQVMLPLLKQSRGRIVNLTSMTGRIAGVYTIPYSCSKYAAEAFSDSLRLEVKPWGISVHMIEPTFYQTDLTNQGHLKNLWYKCLDEQPQEIRALYGTEECERFLNTMFNRILYNKDISDVSGKIKHALLSPLPRRRYIVGKDAFLWVLLSHLPTLVTDFILGIHIPPLRPKIDRL